MSKFKRVDEYIDTLFSAEDDILKAARQAISKQGMPDHSISPVQGHFLFFLAKLRQAKNILEIGTLGAYSTIWMGRAIGKTGRLVTIEVETRFAEVARENINRAGLSSVVDIRVGKALEILPLLQAQNIGPFDMIFIDADKPSYNAYFDWALKLGRRGTLIVVDNVVREGKVLDKESTDEKVQGAQLFNQMLGANRKVTATILQTVGIKEHDGMALAVINEPEQ